MTRTRVNLAWFLRGIAKRINAVAERMDPIKINRPINTASESIAGRTSRDQAQAAIRRAMHPASVWSDRAARR
jgi:hypothetical protein